MAPKQGEAAIELVMALPGLEKQLFGKCKKRGDLPLSGADTNPLTSSLLAALVEAFLQTPASHPQAGGFCCKG